ncbi:MAG: aldo/keto reductase [Bacteroidota bacterium]
MLYRTLGKTGFQVSEISLGTWQVGGKWGEAFDDAKADHILNTAIDNGVNFIDTADVYSAGMSEQAVGRVVRSRSERIYVATKCGRQLNPHTNDAYTPEALREFVEQSLQRTGLEVLDLIQLHCPPREVYYRPEIFGLFERLKEEGKILNLGVSVEKTEDAIKAAGYDNVTTVQIIFNMFRLRPAEYFFHVAKMRNVGIIVRVPLASGLLTGRFSKQTSFGPQDHRQFNRQGEAFDKGETFSGVNYDTGLQAVDRLRQLFPDHQDNLAPMALRWILAYPEVSCVIPGASRVEHVLSNLQALEAPTITEAQWKGVVQVYDEMIFPEVHHIW